MNVRSAIPQTHNSLYEMFTPPATIKVADKPPLLGGVSTDILIDTFVQQHKMSGWCEGLVADKKDIKHLPEKLGYFPLFEKEKIFHSIKKYQQKMVVCPTGDNTGCGIFALDDIPEGTYVSMYAGQLIPLSAEHPLKTHANVYSVEICKAKASSLSASINAEQYGNISRFFQHAPSDLYGYTFENINPNSIATANLEAMYLAHGSQPIICFRTTRKIAKGEQLTWDYGSKYWEVADLKPILFSKNGNEVDSATRYSIDKKLIHVHFEIDGEKNIISTYEPLDVTKVTPRCFPYCLESDSYRVGFTEVEFKTVCAQYQHKPFMIFKNPSIVQKINLAAGIAREKLDLEKETPKPVVASTPSVFNFSNVFKNNKELDNKKTEICKQLKSISSPLLSDLDWDYNENKKMGFTLNGKNEDRENMRSLTQHLKKHGLQVQFGNHPQSKMPTIYVNGFEKVVLAEIEPLHNLEVGYTKSR